MKKIINNILNIDVIIITVIAFVFMRFISAFMPSFSAITPSAQNKGAFSDVLSKIDYYSTSKDTAFNIVLVDMTDLYSRKDIAKLLLDLDSCRPKMVGVDLSFFHHKDESGTIEDDSILIQAVKSTAPKTVFVYELQDYSSNDNAFHSSRHSFFVDSVEVNEGFSNIKNNFDQKAVSVYKASEKLKDQKVYSLTAEMLKLSGMLDVDEDNDIPIDFASTTFKIVDARDFTLSDIQDNFVLVGAARSNDDVVNTPMGAISGLLLHAYTLHSMLNKPKVHVVGNFVNYLFGLIMCYLLAIILVWSDKALDRKPTATNVFIKQSRLLPQIFSVLWLILIMLFSYVILRSYNYYINGLYAIAILAITIETKILYSALIASLSMKRELKFFKHSIYHSKK